MGNIILFMLFLNYFFPPINLGFSLRLTNFLSILIILFLFIKGKITKLSLIEYFYFFLFVLLIFSTFYGYIILSIPISIKDLLEILKIDIRYLPFLLVISASNGNLVVTKYKKFVGMSCVILFIIAVLQKTNLLGLSMIITNLFPAGKHSEFESERVTLTVGNPNNAGIMVLFFLSYYFSEIIQRFSIKSLVCLIMLMLCLFFSGSRTDLIAFVFGVLLTFFIHFIAVRKITLLHMSKWLFSFVVLGLLIYIGYKHTPYIYNGFTTLISGENTSLLLRFLKWEEAISVWYTSPFLGTGPAKVIYPTIVDSDYILILRRYGILGVAFIYAFFFLILLVLIRKFMKTFQILYLREKCIILSTIFMLSVLFIVSVTNVFFSSYLFMWHLLLLMKMSLIILDNGVKRYEYNQNLSFNFCPSKI